jgi:uncharacterized membrane protein YgcG
MPRLIAALVAAIFIAAPLAANAQIAPDGPSYAADSAYGGDAQIHGRILSFDGAYSVQVRDEQGYVDNVQLHQGTIINPTGLTLQPGMVVSILGYNAGSYFAANEIDTPYTYSAGYPYYAGHPWNYYGPGISLGFFFGNAGWWHGSSFGGPYRYYRGERVYNNVHVNTFYHGGAFDGRNYVAPRERGGYEGHPHGNYQGRGQGEFHGGDHGDRGGHGDHGDHGGGHGDHGGGHGDHGGGRH